MTRLLLGTLALLFALPAQAQFTEALAPALDAPKAEAPRSEGVHVRGEWTITVRNADGSVDRVVPFHNDLASTGNDVLVRLLNFEEINPSSPRGRWNIYLEGSPQICERNGASVCIITEPSSSTPPPNYFPTLTRSVEEVEGTMTFVLIGSVVAQNAGSLSDVRTTLAVGTPNGGSTARPITQRTLDAPIAVAAGQSVSVRVEITFE